MNEFKEKYLDLTRSHPNYAKQALYEENKDRIIDLTMSCSPRECIEHLNYYCRRSYANNDEYAFLAAYDLYDSVCESYGFKNEFRLR